MKILIVEDDIASILLLTRTLKKISREVLQVKTGIEAIGQLKIENDWLKKSCYRFYS